MTRFKWNFEGYAATFVSTDASHSRDIFKAAKLLGIAPETKINYHDNKTNRPSIADTFSVNGDTTSDGESTVPVGTEESEDGLQTTKLSDVHGDVDAITITGDSIIYPRDVDDPRNHLQPYWFTDDSVVDDADGKDA